MRILRQTQTEQAKDNMVPFALRHAARACGARKDLFYSYPALTTSARKARLGAVPS
jgi:hypothetical protein